MKRKIYKIFTILFLFIITNNYVLADTSISLTKFVTNVDEINNTFSYELLADSSNPASVSNLVNNFDLVFDNNTIEGRVASKNYIIDFNDAVFSKPGTYKFILRETSSSNEGVYPHDTNYYTLLVNVLNELDENNSPTGQLLIDALNTGLLNDTETKTDVIFETTPLTYFTLSKTVTGDMADKNEYFKFKVNIGETYNYVITGQDSVVNYNGEEIYTNNTYNPNEDNYVYLRHDQTITIGLADGEYQIHAGIPISVEEMDASNYKTYVNNGNTPNKGFAITSLARPSYNNASYVNNYESTALTGVFIRVLPFVLLFLVSFVAIVFTYKKANK